MSVQKRAVRKMSPWLYKYHW